MEYWSNGVLGAKRWFQVSGVSEDMSQGPSSVVFLKPETRNLPPITPILQYSSIF
jgi:hypothetical protein